MNNSQKLLYGLLFFISLSLISAGAQATGISISIGSFGHSYHHGHHYYPSINYRHISPILTYRNHYRPYYGYHHNSYYRSHGRRNYNHHSGHHNTHRAISSKRHRR
jgi:hypothetical protein